MTEASIVKLDENGFSFHKWKREVQIEMVRNTKMASGKEKSKLKYLIDSWRTRCILRSCMRVATLGTGWGFCGHRPRFIGNVIVFKMTQFETYFARYVALGFNQFFQIVTKFFSFDHSALGPNC